MAAKPDDGLDAEVAAARAALEAERAEEVRDYREIAEAREMEEIAERLAPEARARWLDRIEQRTKTLKAADARGRQGARDARRLEKRLAREKAATQAAPEGQG